MKDTSEITREVLRRRDEWRQTRMKHCRTGIQWVAVLALAVMLCGGAAAAGGSELTAFFEGFRRGNLSAEQEAVAELAEDFEARSSVSGDWTVTVDNAICDGMDYYLTVSVTGPVGWMEDVDGCDWAAVELSADGRRWQCWDRALWHEWDRAAADTDYYVMCLTVAEPLEGPLTLQLGDMVLIRNEREDWTVEEESWVFADLEFDKAGAPVELLEEPVKIQPLLALEEERCEVQLDSVQLRTFGLHVSYSGVDVYGIPDPECRLVLKDGTAYELGFSGGADSMGGMLDARFGFPVLPGEVDCILLEGIRLDIP